MYYIDRYIDMYIYIYIYIYLHIYIYIYTHIYTHIDDGKMILRPDGVRPILGLPQRCTRGGVHIDTPIKTQDQNTSGQ